MKQKEFPYLRDRALIPTGCPVSEPSITHLTQNTSICYNNLTHKANSNLNESLKGSTLTPKGGGSYEPRT